MFSVNGLYGHIQRNTLKSALLMATFAALMTVYWYASCLAYTAFRQIFWAPRKAKSVVHGIEDLMSRALDRAIDYWYVPVIIAALWFTIAWIWHRTLISYATGAEAVERRAEPKLYNMVENLAITAGLPMPRVEIMETDALNAYAAGLSPETSTIAVTRGLLDELEPEEIEAVLAHEMTHIKNRDVRLMVVALVFAGGFTFIRQCFGSLFRNSTLWDYLLIFRIFGGGSRDSLSDGDGEEGSIGYGLVAAIVALIAAICTMMLTQVMAVMTQFAVSRSREFLADAGAVELTKNPDAMISALNKISGNDYVPVEAEMMRGMMISRAYDHESFFENLFATHPPIASRVNSLIRYAGGRLVSRPARRVGTVSTSGGRDFMEAGLGFAGARAGFGRR